ncbi:MAG: lysophospholipid acyltransferase family protein [Lentisphaerae bacterium]|nr:lysophospholipid acyltransferase family protein [Lentisphaerota bacterium]
MRFILNSLTTLALACSPERAAAWGRGIGWLLERVVRHRLTEVRETIRRCLTGRTECEAREIARGMYAHLGLTVMEFLRFPLVDRAFMEREIEFDGFEHYENAARQGKGVLILTAHIGNFELMCQVSVLKGVPLTIIAKPVKPAALNDYVERARMRAGVKCVPHHNSVRECCRVLKRREAIGFMLDQNMKRREGVFVDFFGRPACTSPGLAYLSVLAGAPVVPAFIVRLPDGRHRVLVLEAVPPPPDKTPEAIREATQRYTAIIEGMIRRYPDQWIWLHRRWKTQPL